MFKTLTYGISAGLALLLTIPHAFTQEGEPEAVQPAATQPAASRPRPPQAEVYRQLLEEQEGAARVYPPEPIRPVGSRGEEERGAELLPEGTMVVDRAGRLVRSEERSVFRFLGGQEGGALRPMQLLPNGLLEAMENEAEAGVTQFYITALVTRYRGANYLFLQKYRRQVSHGNLSP
jgi:hypothetical protein